LSESFDPLNEQTLVRPVIEEFEIRTTATPEGAMLNSFEADRREQPLE
jgi:hypothetical protein